MANGSAGVSAYYAQVAGLYYGINHTDGGFQVSL